MICIKCGRELPSECFVTERNVCKECRAKQMKAWRERTHYRDKLSGWINAHKTPCLICGESDVNCIDFHHVHPEEKSFTIGKHKTKDKKILEKEIAKCVCLCANCHRKLHAGEINLEEHYVEVS